MKIFWLNIILKMSRLWARSLENIGYTPLPEGHAERAYVGFI
jgi:hypothetical protein